LPQRWLVDAAFTEVKVRTDSLKHRTEYRPASRCWWADRSENNVLMAFLMACWRWLMSPVTAPAPAAYPLTRPAIAALPAARPRLALLATIHVPWPRLTS
jgi:hypothetical protein